MSPSDDKESNKNIDVPKNRSIPANHIENAIKSLSNPRFLGSIHLKKQAIPNNNSVDNLIEDELSAKINKSLRNTILNPITKILVVSFIIFNLIWFLLISIF
jgi:hypothetical protein